MSYNDAHSLVSGQRGAGSETRATCRSFSTINRPITLTETLRKVFEQVLLRELTDGAYWPGNRLPLSVLQGEFRARRSTNDQVAVLQRRRAKGSRFLLAFLDI